MNKIFTALAGVPLSITALLLLSGAGLRAQDAGKARTPWTIPENVDRHALAAFQPLAFKEPMPRKSGFEDMLPRLPISDLVDKDVIENWWYSATLKGSNGLEYAFLWSFTHSRVMGGSLMFREVGAPDKDLGPPLYRVPLKQEKFEVDLAAKRITFVHSDTQGQQARTVIFAPEGMDVTVELKNGVKLELRFRGRGIPYCYPLVQSPKANIFSSGFEDLSLVEGALYSGNTKVQLSGTGVQERCRWSWAATPLDGTISLVLPMSDYFPINLDKGYLLAVQGKDNFGYQSRSGALSLDGQYWYVIDPGKIKIELSDPAEEWPKKAHIVMDTDGGQLELFGTLSGKAMNVPQGKGYINYPLWDYKGTFTYKDGRSLALAASGEWHEHRRVVRGSF